MKLKPHEDPRKKKDQVEKSVDLETELKLLREELRDNKDVVREYCRSLRQRTGETRGHVRPRLHAQLPERVRV